MILGQLRIGARPATYVALELTSHFVAFEVSVHLRGDLRVRKKLHRSCIPCEILLGLSWVGEGAGGNILLLKKLSEVLVCLFSGKTKLNENKLMILSKSPNFVNGTGKEPWLGAPFHVSFRNLITTHAS